MKVNPTIIPALKDIAHLYNEGFRAEALMIIDWINEESKFQGRSVKLIRDAVTKDCKKIRNRFIIRDTNRITGEEREAIYDIP